MAEREKGSWLAEAAVQAARSGVEARRLWDEAKRLGYDSTEEGWTALARAIDANRDHEEALTLFATLDERETKKKGRRGGREKRREV